MERSISAGSVPPLAPVVEDAALAACLLGVAEAVPDVGVLGDDAQGDLLAAAPDQDRYLARGRRVELPRRSSITGIEASRSRAARRRPELVAVRVVVLLEPAAPDPEYEPPAGDVIDRARHVR
jgi:hypothetical protein